MDALVVSAFGDIDVLQFQHVEDPMPSQGEVSIDVLYAAVNFADTKMRKGEYYSPVAPPFILGREVVGRIREVGESTTGFEIGELVAARTTSGAYAPIATARDLHVVRLGMLEESRLEQVAAAPTAVATALLVLDRSARLREGENLLVHGAAGGLGLVMPQIARRYNPANIIGTVSDLKKAEIAEESGYTHILLRDTFHEQIRDIAPRGVDVIVDPVGGSVRTYGFEHAAPLGRIVSLGETSSEEQVAMTGPELRNACITFGGVSLTRYLALDPAGAGVLLEEAIQAVVNGDVVFPSLNIADLSDAGEAHSAIESGHGVGKWILRVSP
jgi:NADPH2:quinone reductase